MRTARPLLRAFSLLALALLASSLTACRRWRPFRRAPVANAHVRHGRALYNRYCALCHGRKLQGYAADHANALGNQNFLAIASDDFLRAAIREGRPGTPMSPWGRVRGGPLAEPEVDDIIAYIRAHARRPPRQLSNASLPGDPDHGRVVWEQQCQSCHGDRGQGTERATSVSHPNFLTFASDLYLRETILEGRPGTLMASFRTLPPQTVNDLVRHIRRLGNPVPPPPVNYEPPPGLDHLIMNPTGRPPAFTLREGRFVPGAQVLRAMNEGRRMVILDTRATSDWSREHIAGALPFPFYDIEQMARQLPRDGTWIVAYCACPHAASGHVVDLLRARGFSHTAVLDEGVTWWVREHYPTAHAAILDTSDHH
jgi:mono/diheme cytochrome c family protein/rhodanese-related sulfurtransferase